MSGSMKTQDLDHLIKSALNILSLQTGDLHYEGYSSYKHLRLNMFSAKVDNISRKIPAILYRSCWDIAMYSCIRILRKHDAVLGLLREKVVANHQSLSLGVVNEFAEAFAKGIPVYVATFNNPFDDITSLFQPNQLVEIFDTFNLPFPYEYLKRSPQMHNQLREPNAATKPSLLSYIS